MSSRRSREDDREDSHRRSKKHSRRDRTSQSDDEDHLIKKARSMIKEISKDDYFIKAAEFRVWLNEKKHKYFNELSSEDARYYFGKFVKAWNNFELDQKYYEGITSAQLSSQDTTRYKWGFSRNVDQHELDSIRDSVDTMTNSQKKLKEARESTRESASDSRRVRRNVGPSLPSSSGRHQSDDEDAMDRRDRERAERKREAKGKRQRDEHVLDEIAPKETGREAQLAKRRAQNAFHKRERSPDVELNESDLYGDDRSSLDHLKRLEKQKQERFAERQRQRTAPIRDKLDTYRAKEDQTMAMFRQMAEEQKKRGGL
ncbi:hypothetical protein K450DRAFT_246986 [Umbelopsis ramanniana AG]|uniref:Uncharacterized protein n=1 Tax=Umbelopsis ramanniana AG TaxID=1314678 RepID=A0AAD5E8U2_UMBRA|nr:uncharacterized protein K450DRAFT_246986 [Umbelopsis ramanniana AG]KAI8578471.1 hypothetical protein K450DRAFT_246986 [Umbelopsis ramanniana AG]